MNNKGCYAYNTLEHTFNGIRVMNRHLCPVKWDLVVKISGIDIIGSEEDMVAQRQMIMAIYQKLQWWLTNYVCDIFLTSMADSATNESFFECDYDNVFVSLPSNPTDDVFIEALHRKLSVLSVGYLHIVEMTLRSDDFNSMYFFSEPAGYRLPMTNDAFEGKALHDKPWWNRADCDLWEPIVLDSMDRTELYDAIETFTDMEEFEEEFLSYLRGEEETEDKSDEPAPIVGMNEWKPTIA